MRIFFSFFLIFHALLFKFDDIVNKKDAITEKSFFFHNIDKSSFHQLKYI